MSDKPMNKTDEALRLARESEFSEEEILRKRRFLAKHWHCPLHCVMDGEAKAIMRQERALAAIDEALGTPPSHTPKAS